MSFCTSVENLSRRFQLVLTSFLQAPDLPFAEGLPEERIQQACQEHGVSFAEEEDEVYTPAITLWAFLSQVLFKAEHRSCAAAVSRIITLMIALGQDPPSDNTSAYCRARAKLPPAFIRQLACDIAEECEQSVPRHWLWHGRHVKLVDGTTASMPDTPENQREFPQSSSQEPGLGFPIVRLVVLLSLATAMISDMAMGPYAGKETGETALLRELFGRLKRGDILLADRYFCSYFMLCLLLELGVDFVTRLHQLRTADFRRGQRLGAGDHVVEWLRPSRPDWMDEATYQRMPKSISVREVQVCVAQPGFRTESLVVVTTLLDARRYRLEEIAELYHQRWLAELDIRAIKVTLGMDVLRCKSPDMVRREMWTCVLAYNLIRQTMLNSALRHARSPRQLSFTAAMQKIAASCTVVPLIADADLLRIIETHLADLSGHKIGHRPNRVEPRAVKRRPKPHKLLTKHRDQARADLLNGRT